MNRQDLRRLVAKQLGLPYISGTSKAGGTTTTLKADEVAPYDDNAFVGAYLYLPSTSETLRITASSGDTLTFSPARSSAPNGVAFEVLPAEAETIHQALEDTLQVLFQAGILAREFRLSLVAGNPIYNSTFQAWSGGLPEGWEVNAGSPTVARATQNPYRLTDEGSVQLTPSGTSKENLALAHPWRRFLYDLVGTTVMLRAWAMGVVARVGVGDVNTGNVTYTDYADAGWTLLSKEVSLDADALGDLSVVLEVDGSRGNAAGWFAEVWLEGLTYQQPIPISLMPYGPDKVLYSSLGYSSADNAFVRPRRQAPAHYWSWVVHEESGFRYGLLEWHRALVGQRLTLEGRGPLTIPDDDTTDVETNDWEALLVAKRAAVKVIEAWLPRLPASIRQPWLQRMGLLNTDVQTMERRIQAPVARIRPDW